MERKLDRLRDREVASDAVAEAFAVPALWRGRRDLPAWVWRSAFRIAAGELKRRTITDRIPEGLYEMLEEPHPLPTGVP
jgi:hypothetical protein